MARRRKIPITPGRTRLLEQIPQNLWRHFGYRPGALPRLGLDPVRPQKIKFDDPALQPIMAKCRARFLALLDHSKELERNFTTAAKTRDITPADLAGLAKPSACNWNSSTNPTSTISPKATPALTACPPCCKPMKPGRCACKVKICAPALPGPRKSKRFGRRQETCSPRQALENNHARLYQGRILRESVQLDIEIRHEIDQDTAQPLYDGFGPPTTISRPRPSGLAVRPG